MRYFIIFILFGTSLRVIGQDSLLEQYVQEDTLYASERFLYLKHVNATDTLCLSDIERAIQQVSDGTLIFCVEIGTFGRLRYENELSELCENSNLRFRTILGDCEEWEGQTQGCYKDYLDSKLSEKYGLNFKAELHKKANDLYLSNHLNDTISGWDCDIEPTSIGEKIYSGDGIYVKVDLPVKEKRDEWLSKGKPMFAVYNPFIDIRFTIDKNGNISNFTLIEFIAQRPENEKYKDRLLELAIKEIKEKYPKWKPGEINGVRLNTTHVLRVQFKNAT